MSEEYKFFSNKKCEYYPCHKNIDEINCLFCYCPLNSHEKCPGTPKYIEVKGKRIKDCSDCIFPHKKENYDKVINLL